LLPTTALSANGHSRPSFKYCLQWHLLLPMETYVSSPLLNVAPNNSPICQCPICQWTFVSCLWMLPAVATPLLLMLLPATALSLMDSHVSFPPLNVALSNSLVCPWTFRCPSLSAHLSRRSLCFHGPSWPRASWPVSTGISFAHYHDRCQDFCSLHGFCLTLEERQCTQPRPCAQNLASLGAGMVASRSGLTHHVIP
jgi:hypothetical protein